MKNFLHFAAATATLIAGLTGGVSIALAMTVQPVVLDLQSSGRGTSQSFSVQNTSANDLPVELSVNQLTIDGSGPHSTGKDPGDLVFFPAQALIKPGESQTFRIQYAGDPALIGGKHYYVTVAQLPVRQANAPSGVQILTNFEVLVSVGPSGIKPVLNVLSANIGRDKDGAPVPVITIANSSATYGYFAHGKLELVEKDAGGKDIYRHSYSSFEIQQALGMGLIDAGQNREFVLPTVLPAAGGSLVATFTPTR